MALNTRDPEAQRLARELADATAETITRAVIKALQERLRVRTSHGAWQAICRSALLGSALAR